MLETKNKDVREIEIPDKLLHLLAILVLPLQHPHVPEQLVHLLLFLFCLQIHHDDFGELYALTMEKKKVDKLAMDLYSWK